MTLVDSQPRSVPNPLQELQVEPKTWKFVHWPQVVLGRLGRPQLSALLQEMLVTMGHFGGNSLGGTGADGISYSDGGDNGLGAEDVGCVSLFQLSRPAASGELESLARDTEESLNSQVNGHAPSSRQKLNYADTASLSQLGQP